MKMDVKSILQNIKTVKIQGAEAVAKASVKAVRAAIYKSKANSVTQLYRELTELKKTLLSLRPTEPCLANTLNFILFNLNILDIIHLRSHLDLRLHKTDEHFEEANKIIIKYGVKKIRKGTVVFTHCHSSTVTNILIAAKKQGKKFSVNNTETRPLLQGRITARQLAGAGIQVKHYVDSATRLAVRGADVVLLGADAITTEGRAVNKIGSELVAEVANRYDVPVYICTDAWKFDPKTIFGFEVPIEKRPKNEIWKNPPKNITIVNPAFEIINPGLITGIISELGVYKPGMFIEEVLHHYPWMLR